MTLLSGWVNFHDAKENFNKHFENVLLSFPSSESQKIIVIWIIIVLYLLQSFYKMRLLNSLAKSSEKVLNVVSIF